MVKMECPEDSLVGVSYAIFYYMLWNQFWIRSLTHQNLARANLVHGANNLVHGANNLVHGANNCKGNCVSVYSFPAWKKIL